MLESMHWILPNEIESRSMELIEQELSAGSWSEQEKLIVKRCIHTSADFDYAENLRFSADAVERGLEALRAGATIVTDTNMAASGINKKALTACGGSVRCFMADENVAEEAKERGVTRAVVCMEQAARVSGPVIIAVGNAPTALVRLYELMQEGVLLPKLVIGAPVGFVNVVESKELIMESQVPYIVPVGRKGGSNIAAAICNALLYQVVQR